MWSQSDQIWNNGKWVFRKLNINKIQILLNMKEIQLSTFQ